MVVELTGKRLVGRHTTSTDPIQPLPEALSIRPDYPQVQRQDCPGFTFHGSPYRLPPQATSPSPSQSYRLAVSSSHHATVVPSRTWAES